MITMSNDRVKQHPYLNVLVREDGCIYLPQSGVHPARWTYGVDNGRGYLKIKYRGKKYMVHRLVLETFVGSCPVGMECDHIDRNTHHNHVSNLRWVSRVQNCRNTLKQDRVEARGLPHKYEDADTYNRGSCKKYYDSHRDAILAKKKEYRKLKKMVQFSDGSLHWVPRKKAEELLKIPKRFRIFD